MWSEETGCFQRGFAALPVSAVQKPGEDLVHTISARSQGAGVGSALALQAGLRGSPLPPHELAPCKLQLPTYPARRGHNAFLISPPGFLPLSFCERKMWKPQPHCHKLIHVNQSHIPHGHADLTPR